MKRLYIFALVAGLVLAVGTAQALTLSPSISNTQSWNGGTVDSPTDVGDANQDYTPYWDGNTKDYTRPGNIGNWLMRTGAFGTGSGTGYAPSKYKTGPGVAYPYIGTSPAGDLEIYFTSTNPNWAAIRIEVAGLEDVNFFGIYKKGTTVNPDNLLTPGGPGNDWWLLFAGSQGAGSTKVFTPPWQDFGWYLATEEFDILSDGKRVSKGTGKAVWAWFSESSLNNKVGSATQDDQDIQHFVFFEVVKDKSYYIGVEDMTVESTSYDGDYQDMVVFASVIPDASTFALFLSGLPALALLRRRRG